VKVLTNPVDGASKVFREVLYYARQRVLEACCSVEVAEGRAFAHLP
jgi:hypothetical protein